MSNFYGSATEGGHDGRDKEWAITVFFKKFRNLIGSAVLLSTAAFPVYYFFFPDIRVDRVGEKIESVVLSDFLSSCRRFFRMKKVAEGGEDLALVDVAASYETGDCVSRDMDKAKALYEQAAKQGQAWAILKLGTFLENGTFGPPDMAKAVVHYSEAEEKGEPRASTLLGAYYERGDGKATQPDPAKAAEYYARAAEKGDPRAYALLGSLYLNGAPSIPRDCAKAMDFLKKGADAGEGRSMMLIGWTKEKGCAGSRTDLDEAIEWYKKGADAGDDRSATHLVRLNVEWDRGHLDLETVAVHFLEAVLLTAALFFGGRFAFLKLARFRGVGAKTTAST